MEQIITGKTKLYGIIGYPIAHSLSPCMQNSAFAAAGVDAVYVPFPVHPDSLQEAVTGLQALGIQGFNVTIPHKTAIIPFLHRLDVSAEDAGAVNTVKSIDGLLIGYNTDGDGLLRSLAQDCCFEPKGSNVLMYGAGGAARGAAAALCRASVNSIAIVNRTEQTALELVSFLAPRYPQTEFYIINTPEKLDSVLPGVDLLLNTTSLGMKQEKLPWVVLDKLASSAIVYDMVYSPPRTPLLQDAEKLSLCCANGLGMLACQGELAFERWTGISPLSGCMRQTLERVCRA